MDADWPCKASFSSASARTSERGMPLIQMEPENVLIAKRSQQAEAPDPQHDLLTQAIMVVAPVEHIGERPVPGLVLAHIRIEQIYRNDQPGLTPHSIPPGPDMDRATFDERP